MPMFRVKLTRLVEQECSIYVRAATAEEAQIKALAYEEVDASGDHIADAVWDISAFEPHTYTAEAKPTAPDTVQTPAERPQDAAPTTRELRNDDPAG